MPSVTDRQGRYPSDLSEEQWNFIKDLIPSARRGGRPRSTDEKRVVDACFYLIRTGCPWRFLPKEFPPWRTVYEYFKRWSISGVWKSIHDRLRDQIRKEDGRNTKPSYLILDSQSVRACRGEALGYDGFKRVRGRKRHIFVDTLGLIHDIYIHAGDLSDTKEGAKAVFNLVNHHKDTLKVMHVDQGYRGTFIDTFSVIFGFIPLMYKRENTGQGKRKSSTEKRHRRMTREKIDEPKRWIVERTFAWFNGSRRLLVDHERSLTHCYSMIYLSMTGLMLRRVAPVK